MGVSDIFAPNQLLKINPTLILPSACCLTGRIAASIFLEKDIPKMAEHFNTICSVSSILSILAWIMPVSNIN